MARYQADTRVGLLGGGQLARMLAQGASQLGLQAAVMSSSKEDPGAQVTGHHQKGSLKSLKQLTKFLKSVDIATFESEFLNSEALELAQKKSKTKIYPSPQIMGQIQDRKSQKTIFDTYKLKTSPWINLENSEQAHEFIKTQGYPVVFKKRHFGYDGYGTFVIKTTTQLKSFLAHDFKSNQFIVEKFIPFKKELAIMIARSLDGSFTYLPLVETKQKDARCLWVKGPVKNPQINVLLKKLSAMLKKLDYVGVMGVEFFATTKGLIINEVAPRVHNSGHYSQNTNGPSQFDLHWMCLMGEKLPKKIDYKQSFAMYNLLGGQAKKVQLQAIPGLHWYGKKENRLGRKMGHINCVSSTPQKALNMALASSKRIKL